MSPLEAILLGIVQGLTEFLPISSSGHLILVPWLLDIRYLEEHPDFNKTFDVALHIGTLAGVVTYFRAEVRQMISGSLSILRTRSVTTKDEKLALLIIIGTVPAVILGATLEPVITKHLGEPWQIAILLAVFGLLLAYADRLDGHRSLDDLKPKDALKVGLAQSLSLAPGVSRSGVTITAGRWIGLDRDSAARFGFFLLIPVTAGAILFEGVGTILNPLPEGALGPMALGILASAVAGYAAIAGMLAYVRKRSYDAFVAYRLIVAAIVLLLIATGVQSANF